jgi:hypothetical protein
MSLSKRSLTALAVPAAAVALWACAGGASPTPAPSPPTSAPRPTATAAPTATLEVLSPATYPLSMGGPWLVYRVGDTIFIANPDGSGRRVLYEGATLPIDLSELTSPSGNLLALYGYDDPEARKGPWLRVIRLPLGVDVFLTPLLSPVIEKALADGAEGGSPEVEAATAVTLPDALAWSPNGQQLAFVAALNANSSDLYQYDLVHQLLRRVSTGPNQVASPLWTADSLWIAHQAVEGFGTGAGWQMGSVWTASPDGRRINRLYTPESGGEVFVGWSLGNSLISYSFTQEGYRDLRASGAEGAVQNILVPAYFDDAAYDPVSGMAAYAVSQDAGPGAEPGAYLWGPVMRGSLQVDSREWTSVGLTPGTGLFVFEGPSGVLTVTPEGIRGEIDSPGQGAVSPDGSYLALWGDGMQDRQPGIRLYTGDLEFVRTLEGDPVTLLSWRPDSAGMMAVTESGLIYHPIEGPPILVDASASGEAGESLGWAWP